MGYRLEGKLLEVCDCEVLCPCWIGEDPDGGTCQSVLAYKIEKGEIDGVDVSGLITGVAVYIPGNVLDGNMRAVRYIDDRATDVQEKSVLAAFRGQIPGPLAELASLIGEEIELRRVSAVFTIENGAGTLQLGESSQAKMTPFLGATGEPTTLSGSIFSTIPGSPAYVAKASRFAVDEPGIGVNIDISGHNAIQGDFLFEA